MQHLRQQQQQCPWMLNPTSCTVVLTFEKKMNTEGLLQSYAALLTRYQALLALRRGEHNAWFRERYLDPLEMARIAAGNPWWWHEIRTRCLHKESWDHPQVNEERSTIQYAYWPPQPIEHACLAASVALFYGTMWRAMDDERYALRDCYAALERARAQFAAFQRGSQ